jgi:hypothetical protein
VANTLRSEDGDSISIATLHWNRLTAAAELLTRESFAALLDVGKSTFDRLRETGAIGPQPFRLAGLKWHRDEVLAWLYHRGPDGQLQGRKTWPALWATLSTRLVK